MPRQKSNVIIHKLDFSSELDRVIPHLRAKGEIKWEAYYPRSTYGYVDAVDHGGVMPQVNRYVLTTEGVGSKVPITAANKLEVPWYGQNGFFETPEPWEFGMTPAIKTAYSDSLEDFAVGEMTLDWFIWNKSNLAMWESFFSTKEVIGTA